MKIGILGSGDVAKVLAGGVTRHGHHAMLGTRHAEKLAEWRKGHSECAVGGFDAAAKFGDIVILAVKGSAARDVIQAAGVNNLKGKTVIDATNPIADAAPTNGVLKFFTNLDESLMERLQREIPDANLVKAFNSVGNRCMVNPEFKGGKPTMFICGNSESAKDEVGQLLHQFGWEVEDMGKVEAARAIEPLCMLWCIPGFLKNDWSHAFKLLK